MGADRPESHEENHEALVFLPTDKCVGKHQREARLLYKTRRLLKENAFIEIVIREVPAPLPASRHTFKYRLALVVNENCVMRDDNEAGKGDHKHVGPVEVPYRFEGGGQAHAGLR